MFVLETIYAHYTSLLLDYLLLKLLLMIKALVIASLFKLLLMMNVLVYR